MKKGGADLANGAQGPGARGDVPPVHVRAHTQMRLHVQQPHEEGFPRELRLLRIPRLAPAAAAARAQAAITVAHHRFQAHHRGARLLDEHQFCEAHNPLLGAPPQGLPAPAPPMAQEQRGP